MSLVSLLIALVVLGLVLYLIGLIPFDDTIKQVIRVVAIALIIIWVIKVIFGVSGMDISIP